MRQSLLVELVVFLVLELQHQKVQHFHLNLHLNHLHKLQYLVDNQIHLNHHLELLILQMLVKNLDHQVHQILNHFLTD